MDRFVRGVTIAGGVFMVVAGVWAFADPRSFFDTLATFEPYNEHFLHDIGVFQIGIGVTLLLALVWTDALRVALTGFSVGAGLHFVSHLMDLSLGGQASDPVFFALIAAAGAYAATRRIRQTREGAETEAERAEEAA